MAVIRSFRDLDVYKLALSEAKKVFTVTRRFPAEERYSLTDQLNRMIQSAEQFCKSRK